MSQKNSSKQSTGGLILVVDDDQHIRQAAALHLECAGYRILQASNGQEALSLFDESKEKPVMALLDMVMPVLDGYDTCRRLRQRVKGLRLPILILTGLDDEESVDLAFQAGATDFVFKPINWAVLVQRVRYALRDRDMYLELEQKEKRLSHAQRIAKLGYGQINLTTGVVDFSPEIAEMLGMEGQSVMSSREFFDLLEPADQKLMQQALDDAVTGSGQYMFEHRLQLPDQPEKVILQQGEAKQVDGEWLIIGTLQDITERARAEEMIYFHTYYDPLSDLPNRTLFEKQLNEQLRRDELQAVLFVALDRFKAINDSLGHTRGDLLLKEIATRFNILQWDAMLVARFAGNIFSIYLPKVGSVEEVDDLAQSLLEIIAIPVVIGEHNLEMSASIGIALYPLEVESSERLLLGADTALNLAKQYGGAQYRYFSSELDGLAQERLLMEQELREAIKRDQFELYYQPQIDARSQEIVGVEALIRWNHPSRGVVPAFKFIPLSEETGMIIPIGEWVLNAACQQAKRWLDKGIKVRVGVNLSVKQLQLENFPVSVVSALKISGLPPEQLDLEVTESMAISDLKNTISVLEKIRELGVLTSMDDFGTGYSSLSHLQQLPLCTMKIDRAFIKDIDNDGNNAEIAKIIIDLSRNLGLHVIAEGIETRSQFEQLLMHGCDEIQGFYFSKPLNVAEFEALYEKTQGRLFFR
ncbi:diguanylate cyclase/phosphodiesterase (GGDEF & EAL domains) with PAS/PAC sensor(s) [hydrothermal vent metagenome]|uniref:Diguanylate cyclase/phosphodiesterase (GGDEF & EAL domains) with PAS/PAC sensor(S) n=1 Tax=hydrothermal vent metagenome TaxID=652676 RepID=A0A3B0ZRH7_9ZZZZ